MTCLSRFWAGAPMGFGLALSFPRHPQVRQERGSEPWWGDSCFCDQLDTDALLVGASPEDRVSRQGLELNSLALAWSDMEIKPSD